MAIDNQDEIITNVSPLQERKLTPVHRLSFAKSILFGLAILFVLGMIISTFTHNNEIFDACKTVLPPIATLIIGYYFGEKSGD